MKREPPPATAEAAFVKARQEKVRSVVYDFLSRRDSGQYTSPEDFQKRYPELMPELGEALIEGSRKLRLLMDAERAAADEHSSSGMHHRPKIAHFSIVREISAGGQGTVFEAIHELTGRTVAVKVMSVVSKHSLARFEREVQAMASLDHPGIVKIIDFGRTIEGTYFLAMDYVAGEDLDQWVARQKTDAEGQKLIIGMFRKIANAIDAAHRRGIVHRDLKPSNIRVDSLGDPRIVDFGLACLAESNDRNLTATGNIVGSIPWSSPEQAAGTSADAGPESDVYSLGVLLYHSLTGQFPYSVEGPLHTVTGAICSVPPVHPMTIRNAAHGPLDEAISEILLNCLSKHRHARPATGGALASGLDRYLQGEYVAAPRRLQGRQILMVLACLAIGAAGFIAWPRSQQQVPTLSLQLPRVRNTLGMEMVKISPGVFTMGSSVEDRGHMDNEQQRRVRITRPFYISKTEVTRGQYRRLMGSLPKEIINVEDDSLPVDYVNRDDAREFCRRLSQLEGKDYRLPTEAEWEYACRSGTRGVFAGSEQLMQMGWYMDNSGQALQPVATLAPNQWGLYDMHGNVSEWVADGYVRFLGGADATDPQRDDEAGKLGVVRGGTVNSSADLCRSSQRDSQEIRIRTPLIGFRVVLSASSDLP